MSISRGLKISRISRSINGSPKEALPELTEPGVWVAQGWSRMSHTDCSPGQKHLLLQFLELPAESLSEMDLHGGTHLDQRDSLGFMQECKDLLPLYPSQNQSATMGLAEASAETPHTPFLLLPQPPHLSLLTLTPLPTPPPSGETNFQHPPGQYGKALNSTFLDTQST